MPQQATKYRFGPYEVQIRTRELYKQGTRLKLRPQAFQVLNVLLERAGDVVTREELRQRLWPAGTFVGFEQGLNTSIKELRRALSDSPVEPRYIETLPKVGYRMIVPVEREEPASEISAFSVLSAAIPEPEIPTRVVTGTIPKPGRQRTRILYGVMALLVAALAGYWQWRRVRVPPHAADARLMFAVLPFENLTGDVAQEYLSDGLTEEMIAQFGRLDPQHLGVIARTSVMAYKHSQKQLNEIARELSVQYVLEGSVRTDAKNVRISVQLIRAKDQAQAWAKEYNRPLINLLTMEDEIAQEISDEIELSVGDHKPRLAAARPVMTQAQYEAYDFYLKGLYFWNKRTVEGFLQAIKYYKEALAKDANHAPSYAGMADCYAMLGGYSGEPRPEYITQARSAAVRAMEIDNTLPEAHAALAVVLQDHDWDWQTAEKQFRRAIELNPNYATGHHWYAEHLAFEGRFDEGIRESERARQLDPLSLIITVDEAVLLYYSRQYDRSIRRFAGVAELDPNFSRVAIVAFPYVERHKFVEALQAVRRPSDRGPWFWAELAYVYGRSGQPEEARRALAKLLDLSRLNPVDPSTFVITYLGVGNQNEAIAWLEKAYEGHSNTMVTIKVDPIFDPLRGDPRFQDLVRRVGF